jgi:hypothetical protein
MHFTLQWRYVSESRSVRATTGEFVYFWIVVRAYSKIRFFVLVDCVRAWYLSSGCVVVNRGPCVVLEQCLCGCGWR